MCINFLDLTITRQQTNHQIDIYRRPTTTDTTINFLSNHPKEHKMAAFRYHISRMYSFPLAPEKETKRMEINTTNSQKQQVPTKSSTEIKPTNITKTGHIQTEEREDKNVDNIHLMQPSKKKITIFFKHANIGIAFRNTNILQQLTNPKILNQTPEKYKSTFYELTCNTCHRSYIGQTSHSIKLRFQEHT